MVNLIYLCSLGDRAYRRMTELCVRSLRRLGRYEGRILVITNNGYEASDPDTEVIRVGRGLDRHAMHAFKAAAARFIEAERYGKILGMDCDMLAIDDIEPLFRHSDDCVSGMEEEPWTLMTDAPCGGCLTDEERKGAEGRWGINAGLLCSPARIFPEYTELWLREIYRRREQLTCWLNQPPFNALVAGGRIPFRPYPRAWIDIPPMYRWHGGRFRVTEETRVLHFCWAEKDQTVEEMEVFLSELDGDDRPPEPDPERIAETLSPSVI